MIPAYLDLTVQEYDTYSNTITWDAGGTPVDLTGATASMQCRLKYGGSQVFALSSTALTPNGSGITLGGTAGTITINITNTDAISIPLSEYSLVITFPNGSTSTVIWGWLFMPPGVTQP